MLDQVCQERQGDALSWRGVMSVVKWYEQGQCWALMLSHTDNGIQNVNSGWNHSKCWHEIEAGLPRVTVDTEHEFIRSRDLAVP